MFIPQAHIIIIDGAQNSGRKTFALELAVTLLHNAQKTALVLSDDSPLRQTISQRHEKLSALLTPAVLNREEFYDKANNFDAVIIPQTNAKDDLALTASTYITLLPKSKKSADFFRKNPASINNIWELKKKIASFYKHSLNWIVCENNLNMPHTDEPTPELVAIARTCGFRVSPPFNRRLPYQKNISGISAQDKSLPELKKYLTYEDICAKREFVKLAEFIFNA